MSFTILAATASGERVDFTMGLVFSAKKWFQNRQVFKRRNFGAPIPWVLSAEVSALDGSETTSNRITSTLENSKRPVEGRLAGSVTLETFSFVRRSQHAQDPLSQPQQGAVLAGHRHRLEGFRPVRPRVLRRPRPERGHLLRPAAGTRSPGATHHFRHYFRHPFGTLANVRRGSRRP